MGLYHGIALHLEAVGDVGYIGGQDMRYAVCYMLEAIGKMDVESVLMSVLGGLGRQDEVRLHPIPTHHEALLGSTKVGT
jgi:hypothetical protein